MTFLKYPLWLVKNKKKPLPNSSLKFIDGEENGKKEESVSLNSLNIRKQDSSEFLSELIKLTNASLIITFVFNKFSVNLNNWRQAIMLGPGLHMMLAMINHKLKNYAPDLPRNKILINSNKNLKKLVSKIKRYSRLWKVQKKQKKKKHKQNKQRKNKKPKKHEWFEYNSGCYNL